MVFLTTQFRRQESRATSASVSSAPVESQQFIPEETGLHRFSYAEIRSATRKFNESLLIGRGGFGKVYKGTLNYGGRIRCVAIKRLNPGSYQGASEFQVEIEMLSIVRHCNLVSLIGYCNNREEMMLVYEFMPNGSLHDRLHSCSSPLSWLQRLRICLGIAHGSHYLHDFTGTDHGIVHCDLKSSNILLDENLQPKITDFGLSRVVPKNDDQASDHDHLTATGVLGTPGYLDPGFQNCKLSVKSDVYLFGIMLLEVLSGRYPVDRQRSVEQQHIVAWAKSQIEKGELEHIVDSSLRGQILPDCLMKFIEIAFKCVQNESEQRPSMAEVVASLHYLMAIQEKADDYQPSLASLGLNSDVDQEAEDHEDRHYKEDVSHDESIEGSTNSLTDYQDHKQNLQVDQDEEEHLFNDSEHTTSSGSEQQDHVGDDLICHYGGAEPIVAVVSKTRASSWRGHLVSESASRLLHLVEEQYPQTFQSMEIHREKVWEVYLEAFEQIMTRLLKVVVADLTMDTVVDLRSELKELSRYGFEMTWALEWLDSAARFRDVEYLKQELSKLEQATAHLDGVVERLKEELAAAEIQRTEIVHLRDVKAEELTRLLGPGQEHLPAGSLGLDLLRGY